MPLDKTANLTGAEIQEIVRAAADRAAKIVREEEIHASARVAVITVLQELGLADDDGRIGNARDDIVDLRDLMQTLRLIKRRLRTLILIVIFAVSTPAIIAKLKGWL